MLDPTAAVRLFDPDLGPLVDELVRRFASGHLPVRITIPVLSERGRSRLADILGLDRYPVEGKQLAVERLATALGAGDVHGLRAAVEAMRGPLGDRRAERLAAQRARTELWGYLADAAATLTIFPTPAARSAWVERAREVGVPGGDIGAHRQRLEQAVAALQRLPASPPLTLAGLAADETGSGHGLDPGRRLTRLVLDGLAIAFGAEPANDAEAARALWERAGVVPDPLSSTVLTLGMRSHGDGATAAYLRASSHASEPVVLTLRQLQTEQLEWSAGNGTAYVFENPSLLADAAGRWRGPPLICSSGRPSVAVLTLIRQLVLAGISVHQHADLDAAGIAITQWLTERAGTIPWGMTSHDYLAAIESQPTTELTGKVDATPWDPALARVMRAKGRAVHEEAIRADLLRRAR